MNSKRPDKLSIAKFFSKYSHCALDLDPFMLKYEFVRCIVILNTCVKLYWNWMINEGTKAMTKFF